MFTWVASDPECTGEAMDLIRAEAPYQKRHACKQPNVRRRCPIQCGVVPDPLEHGALARGARREGNVIVYNRIGKCGSSSLTTWLKHRCEVQSISPADAFAPTNRTRAELQHLVDGMRGSSGDGCKVVIGHFAYVPLDGVEYINVACEPVARWITLHNFYMWSAIPFNRSAVQLKHCSGPSISTWCLDAPDTHMSIYLGAATERSSCDIAEVWRRYSFMATLEEMQASTQRLSDFLRLKGAEEPLPHSLRTHHRESPDLAMRLQLATELSCDLSIWWLASHARVVDQI